MSFEDLQQVGTQMVWFGWTAGMHGAAGIGSVQELRIKFCLLEEVTVG